MRDSDLYMIRYRDFQNKMRSITWAIVDRLQGFTREKCNGHRKIFLSKTQNLIYFIKNKLYIYITVKLIIVIDQNRRKLTVSTIL
jgi:hypothetical protein